MNRKLLLKIFETADALHDPCGAAAFVERLGRELDAGRIVFPTPLTIGGGFTWGCVVVDRGDSVNAARTLVRALADLAEPPDACVAVGLLGRARPEIFAQVTQQAGAELAGRGEIGLLIVPVASRCG
jgi:hypothetical protein